MPNEFYSIVTDFGFQKQMNSLNNGVAFDLYEIALGDGNGEYYEPVSTQTQLKHEVWRGVITTCEWEQDKFYCVVNVPANDGGFYIREAGVFDNSGNMIAITKFPETYKQTPDSGTVKQLTIRIEVHFLNNEIAPLIVNPDIQTATKTELDALEVEIQSNFQVRSEKGLPNGYAPLDSNGLLPLIHLPEIDTKSLLTPFCLNNCLLDSRGNPDLLSSETVKIKRYTASSLVVFYADLNTILAKDVGVYSDTELQNEAASIVAIDTTNLTRSFGIIEKLGEDENTSQHFIASETGDFYIQSTLALGVTCYSDAECTQSIGVVTFLNLTKIAIGEVETYTVDGNVVVDVIDLIPATAEETVDFNLFIKEEDGEYVLIPLANTIFTQILPPSSFVDNDVWFKILEPLASYISILNIWQSTDIVPIGAFTLEGGDNTF